MLRLELDVAILVQLLVLDLACLYFLKIVAAFRLAILDVVVDACARFSRNGFSWCVILQQLCGASFGCCCCYFPFAAFYNLFRQQLVCSFGRRHCRLRFAICNAAASVCIRHFSVPAIFLLHCLGIMYTYCIDFLQVPIPALNSLLSFICNRFDVAILFSWIFFRCG
ncbi:unnamed protein product [Lathyrus oleraceus]|uniref:uncharacterized protein LOC127097403 n=1 Tax=Pisum sativum TaxID=3888 RepID=UPI001FC4B5B2|nr:uncharacterized protein LOC127097403 [Pisum sativum]